MASTQVPNVLQAGKLQSAIKSSLNRLWRWTGFGSYTDPDGKHQSGKTLWDWMQLLFVPLLIAGGIAVFQNSTQAHETALAAIQAQNDRNNANDNAQETTLEGYISQMEELLLKEGLSRNLTQTVLQALLREL